MLGKKILGYFFLFDLILITDVRVSDLWRGRLCDVKSVHVCGGGEDGLGSPAPPSLSAQSELIMRIIINEIFSYQKFHNIGSTC